ncbi:MAG: DUF4349 domain-containing protein [Chloroflexota bacterium]|nr:DUF4349 domain-containing protein [Chloroflexota bacterium]
MNGSMWFRGLVRFWRVGAAISGVIVVALVAMLIIGRNSDASMSNGKSALITTTNAPPPTTAPVAAATTAAGRAAPAAAAPGTTGSAVSGGAANRTASTGASSDASTILNAPLPPQTIDQRIIRDGSLAITAKDVVGTQAAIWNLAGEFGGVVITSNTSGTSEHVRADIAFRVPSERFREAMDRVRGYAVTVEKEQSAAQDVTEEYVDLQARQRTLEATTLQLQTLLGKATTVDDTLKVQAQLNNAQSDLERIKVKVHYYDTRTAFSTVSVSIVSALPIKPEPVTPVAKWSLGHSIQEAWNRSVNGLQHVADALITVIIGGWWIEIPLIVAIALLVRREQRRQPVLVPVAPPVSSVESPDRPA